MKSEHNRVMAQLADYLHGNLDETARTVVDRHLSECNECREELAVLKTLQDLEVPDPGELYWKTLPQRVRVTVEERRRRPLSILESFFRPLSVATAALLIVVSLLLYMKVFRDGGFDPLFEDPLAAESIDYSEIPESAIPPIRVAGYEPDGNGGYSYDYSFYEDLETMGPEELDSLLKTLDGNQYYGG